jgi:hypothetical protein
MPFGFIYEREFDPQIPRDAPWGNATSVCPIRMNMSCPLRSHYNGIRQGRSLSGGQRAHSMEA